MKDKSKHFLDLSKCTGEELKNIYTILGDTLKFESPSIVFNFPIMHYHEGMWIRTNFFQDKAKKDNFLENKTEITYPEFIKLFEGGDGESKEISFETEYNLEEFRKIQSEYFDENGNCYTGIHLSGNIMEQMLTLINQLENELNSK